MDLAKLQPVATRVIEEWFASGPSSLSERDQVFFLVWGYETAIDDGGFASFYYNSFADHFTETLRALRTLGLSHHAKLLERSASILFASAVPRTMDERNAVIDQLPDDVGTDEEFDELHSAYRDLGGGDHVLEVLQNWYFS